MVSDGTKRPQPPQLVGKGRPFPKGVSPNPGGKPPGFERRLRECVESMRANDPAPDPTAPKDKDGKVPQIPAFEAIVKQAVLAAVAGDRYARDFIADRLMGKAKVNVDIKSAATRKKADLSAMSVDEKRNLLVAYETMQRLTGADSDEDPASISNDDAQPTEH